MRGQTDRAQRRHQPGEDHMPRRGGQTRQRHGHGDAQAVLHRSAIGPEHAAARRDGGVLPHHHGDEHAAQHVRKRRGDGRAAHAQTRAGHGEGQAEDAHLPRRVDEKEVHDDIEAVHGGVGQHRRARIPRRAQHGAEDDGGGAEEHRHADDAEIGRGVGLDLFLRVEPSRERGRHQQRHGAHHRAGREDDEHGLPSRLAGGAAVLSAQRAGDDRQSADASGEEHAVDQPRDRAGQSHGGGGLRAQHADHGGIHILHQRLHGVFQHHRPGQGQKRRRQRPVFAQFGAQARYQGASHPLQRLSLVLYTVLLCRASIFFACARGRGMV